MINWIAALILSTLLVDKSINDAFIDRDPLKKVYHIDLLERNVVGDFHQWVGWDEQGRVLFWVKAEYNKNVFIHENKLRIWDVKREFLHEINFKKYRYSVTDHDPERIDYHLYGTKYRIPELSGSH